MKKGLYWLVAVFVFCGWGLVVDYFVHTLVDQFVFSAVGGASLGVFAMIGYLEIFDN